MIHDQFLLVEFDLLLDGFIALLLKDLLIFLLNSNIDVLFYLAIGVNITFHMLNMELYEVISESNVFYFIM